MKLNKMFLCFLILLIIFVEVLLVIQPVPAKPLPPGEHIVSYEQFISGNGYAGEFISMSAKIKEIELSGTGYGYTIQLMPLEEETNKSANAFIQVKNMYIRYNDFIRDERIGILLKKGYNIVVIGKAVELKEKNRSIYIGKHGTVDGTIILLLKNNEYNEIKDKLHSKAVISVFRGVKNIQKYTNVATHKIQHNMSTYGDIFAVGSYTELSLLDYNSKLLDSDEDDLFDPIDPYPNEKDIDKDKLSDREELELGTDPGKNDTDSDTISDYTETHGFVRGEITFFTDPNNPDTDSDGIRDDVDSDPAPMDTDCDRLLDREELKIGTDVKKKDTDNDGLTDFEEVRGTRGYKSDPLKKDTDGDGISDKAEIDMGSNPKATDTDSDGLTDFEEVRGTRGYKTDPLKRDTDGDGISDKAEIDRGLNPRVTDTDGDRIKDSEDYFPRLNNNFIYGLLIFPIIAILVLFIIHKIRNTIRDVSQSDDDTLDIPAGYTLIETSGDTMSPPYRARWHIKKEDMVIPISNIEEIGKYAECPYCGSNIRETFNELGGIVRCDKCGAFHHKECFEYYGKKCGSSSCKLRDT